MYNHIGLQKGYIASCSLDDDISRHPVLNHVPAILPGQAPKRRAHRQETIRKRRTNVIKRDGGREGHNAKSDIRNDSK